MTLSTTVVPSRHGISACGIASLVLALIALVWQAGALWSLWTCTRPGMPRSPLDDIPLILGYLAYLAGAAPAACGIVLGALGTRRKFSARGLALAALVLNTLLVLLTPVVAIMSPFR